MEKHTSDTKLLDMEHNLAGDKAELYAKKYDRTLLLLKKRAQASIEEGLEQHEYASTQLLIDAVDTARKLIKLTASRR